MRTATRSRRHFLADATAWLAGAAAPGALTAASVRSSCGAGDGAPVQGRQAARAQRSDPEFAASWQEGSRYFVGVLGAGPDGVRPLRRREVPTRAHGIAVEPQGSILLVARRPGDWLLRFDPIAGAIVEWDWSEGDHVYNGHVIRSADGRRLFTTETSLESGAGSIGVRDARSLALLARWATGGIDPHEVVLGPDGGLWVANGGIETRPETGRIKHRLEQMDSSLVRLDPVTGRLTGQWRLDDGRLGLRHLAVASDGTIGIALQSEHDDDGARQVAPVLGLWDRRRGLRPVPLPSGVMLAGYGGSVAPLGGGIAVSCPRAGLVVRWDLAGGEPRWLAPVQLAQACPIAAGWLGGAGAVVHADGGGEAIERLRLDDAIRLDNHWALMDRSIDRSPTSPSTERAMPSPSTG